MANCSSKVAKAFKISLEEAQRIEDQAIKILEKSNKEGIDPIEAFEEARRRYTRQIKVDKLRAVKTEQAVKARKEYFNQPAFKDRPDKALESLIIADTTGNFKGVGNMENTRATILNEYGSIVQQEIGKIPGGMDRLKSGADDLALMKILTGEAVEADEAVHAMAKVFRNIQDSLHQRMTSAGFDVKYKKNRAGKQFHDRAGMLEMKEKPWKNLAREVFDFEAMGIEKVADQEAYLQKMWKGRTKGPDTFWKISDDMTEVVANKAQSKYEVKSSIEFKSAEARLKYNQLVNKKNMFELLSDEVNFSAGDMAAASFFGPNHKAGIEKLFQHVKDLEAGMDKPKLTPTRENQLRSYYQAAVRPSRQPGTNMLARFGDKMRKLTDILRMDRAILSTVTDVAYGSNVVSELTGKNLLSSHNEIVGGFFKGIAGKGSKNLKDVSSRLGVFMDDMISLEMSGRLGEDRSMSSTFDKFHNWTMKATGLQQQSVKMRQTIAKAVSTGLHDVKDKAFDQLYIGSKRGMERFGIGAKEWDIIRKQGADFGDGTFGLVADTIEDMEIRTKWSSFLTWAAENGSPTAGIKRTAWKSVLDPNTVGGQAMMFMGQYKAFTLSMFDTMSMLGTVGAGPEKFLNMKRIGSTMALSTAYGSLAITLKHMARGKDPRDIDFDSPEFFLDSFLQGGSGMIYMDFLSGEYNKSYKSLAKDVAGPAVGIADDFASVFAAAVRGDLKAKQMMRTMERNTPSLVLGGAIIKKYMFEAINKGLNID